MKRLESLLGSVAAVALFSMMLMTAMDVVGRKFFNQSLTGAVELTELFMLVMIFFSLPLASLASEHIVFDLFDRVLPAKLLRWQKVFSHGLTTLVFGAAAWIVFERAQRTTQMGDMTSALEIRLAPFHYLVAVLLVITTAAHAWLAWREYRSRIERRT